jgi:hypothetical protein
VCARGASALEDVLRERPQTPVDVLAVWERVVSTAVAPAAMRAPPTSMLARIPDRRVAQFWDPGPCAAGASHGRVLVC